MWGGGGGDRDYDGERRGLLGLRMTGRGRAGREVGVRRYLATWS